MKTIQPVQVWHNGQEVNATILNAFASGIQLDVSANFNYELLFINEHGYLNRVNSGLLNMQGQDYQDWDQDSFAWNWVASQLNLTITGDYVPPVPAVTPTFTGL